MYCALRFYNAWKSQLIIQAIIQMFSKYAGANNGYESLSELSYFLPSFSFVGFQFGS